MASQFGVSIVVGIPTLGKGVSHFFAQARQGQMFPLVSSSMDYYCVGKPIAEARNEIVQYAIDNDAMYIYWLDDDVIPPQDAFLKLWKHQKDIINGVYWSKSNPPMPLLFRGHLGMPYLDWHVGDLIEIDAAGNGLTLVKTEVYKKIEREIGGPWYSVEYGSFPGVKQTPHNNTEDLYFYWKAKRVGYKVWADTGVQAHHYDKNTGAMYQMPTSSPQANPAWAVKPLNGEKLIADYGSGGQSPYMLDEGITVSFDIREEAHPDVICDLRSIPVPDDTFDIVFSSHTLEHFGWRVVDKILKEWVRTLKVGGQLRIVVPNARHAAERILKDEIVPTDMWVMMGEQEYAKNFHGTFFTPNILTRLVESLGNLDNIQVKEGDYAGPPTANVWNLQLKATKFKNFEMDNIAPPDMKQGSGPPAFYPVRIYDESVERPMTPEETMKDLTWLGGYDDEAARAKKAVVVDMAKSYKVNQSDKAYFADYGAMTAEEVDKVVDEIKDEEPIAAAGTYISGPVTVVQGPFEYPDVGVAEVTQGLDPQPEKKSVFPKFRGRGTK